MPPAKGPDRYHKIDHDPEALQALLVELFSQAHSQPPDSITLDLDATDDPLHGEQQLDLFAIAPPPTPSGPTNSGSP